MNSTTHPDNAPDVSLDNTPKDPRPYTWPRGRVLKYIRKAEGSMTQMAKRLEVSPQHLHEVMRGEQVSTRLAGEIARAIAPVLGREVRPCDIWPKLYAEDGGPKSSAYRRLPKAS